MVLPQREIFYDVRGDITLLGHMACLPCCLFFKDINIL